MIAITFTDDKGYQFCLRLVELIDFLSISFNYIRLINEWIYNRTLIVIYWVKHAENNENRMWNMNVEKRGGNNQDVSWSSS